MNDSIRQAQADTRDEAALPPLPVTLWPKLAAAQRRRRILLQYGLRTAGLVTTLVLVAGIALLVDPPGREADPALPGEILADAAAAVPVHAQIAAVDQALDTAYHRGAGEDELAPLWQLRAALAARTTPETRHL